MLSGIGTIAITADRPARMQFSYAESEGLFSM